MGLPVVSAQTQTFDSAGSGFRSCGFADVIGAVSHRCVAGGFEEADETPEAEYVSAQISSFNRITSFHCLISVFGSIFLSFAVK